MTSPSGAFIVIAEFLVKSGEMEAFLEIAHDDARHSVADEPECHQFDVILSECAADVVVFYEVYSDRAAFDAHLETPHLKRFQKAFPSLIVQERPVRFFARHAR